MCTYIYIYIYIYTRVSQKVMSFSLVQECSPKQEHISYIQMNLILCESHPYSWIVSVSFNCNVPLSNESTYSCFLKFCWTTSSLQFSLSCSEHNVDHFFGRVEERLRCKNFASDEEVETAVIVIQRTASRILQGRFTCSHSKMEHCY